MALLTKQHISPEQHAFLERSLIRDREWMEAISAIDLCDREAADLCERLLHAYEGYQDLQTAASWEATVKRLAHDPLQVPGLKRRARTQWERLHQSPLLEPVPEIRMQPPVAPTFSPDQAAPVQPIARAVQPVAGPVQALPDSMPVATPRAKTRRSWDIRRPPMSQKDMEKFGPLLRILFGAGMIGYSNIAATLLIGWILDPLLPQSLIGVFTYAHAVGLLFGVAVTIGQWATKMSYPTVHWFLVLALDAPFSAVQTYLWLLVIAQAHFIDVKTGTISQTTWLICLTISLLWGVVTAKLGEYMLLGRKQTR